MKLDSLHFALLVAIVLLAVYAFGSFREGASGYNKFCTEGGFSPCPHNWTCVSPGMRCARKCTNDKDCNSRNVYGWKPPYTCKNGAEGKYCVGQVAPTNPSTWGNASLRELRPAPSGPH